MGAMEGYTCRSKCYTAIFLRLLEYLFNSWDLPQIFQSSYTQKLDIGLTTIPTAQTRVLWFHDQKILIIQIDERDERDER